MVPARLHKAHNQADRQSACHATTNRVFRFAGRSPQFSSVPYRRLSDIRVCRLYRRRTASWYRPWRGWPTHRGRAGRTMPAAGYWPGHASNQPHSASPGMTGTSLPHSICGSCHYCCTSQQRPAARQLPPARLTSSAWWGMNSPYIPAQTETNGGHPFSGHW